MLLNIIADLAADNGIRTVIPAQRERLVSVINDAARELYDTKELKNSLREQLFACNQTDQQITLPWYVAEVRACRDYDSQMNYDRVDMSPRYFTLPWFPPFLQMRIKLQDAGLQKSIGNDGRLTVTFAQPVETAVNFTIVGKTPDSARTVEILVFAAGDSSKQTVNIFQADEGTRFFKSAVTTYNCEVLDIDGEVIAEIPNHELASRNTLIQIQDRWQQFGQERLIEILYKTRFTPFLNDTDQFPCGDLYDKAIYWKTSAFLLAKRTDAEGVALAGAAEGKCERLITDLAINKELGINKYLDFGPSRWRNIHRSTSRTGFGGEFGYNFGNNNV